MEILPLLFMQAAVLKWNTCTTKCKTHPQRSWRWKSCHCYSCKQQCWNGTHVPQNAKHIPKGAEDGNPAIVIHASSSVEMEHMYHKMQNTSPKELTRKFCHCYSCKQQCWNGTHVPQNAKHTQIEAKDGNPVIVVHELPKYQRYKGKMHDHQDASLSIHSEFTSPNKLPVI